ncbi:MAG: NAD-dependent protein deacylase [Eubacteriaceae bacterium]
MPTFNLGRRTDVEIENFRETIMKSHCTVFFGGAGVSTESGIPDFRSVDGLYHQTFDDSPEEILSHSFFMDHPLDFYEFYRQKMLYLDAKPNKAHLKLAEMESKGKLAGVITQNIDGLHQIAGSKNVLELHGSVYRNYCMKCHQFYEVNQIKGSHGIPMCTCGGIIKPEVVLYGENLDDRVIKASVDLITKAEVLIIGGTSLGVYPAAGLIEYYRGNQLILINKTPTSMDNKGNALIRKNIGEVFGEIEL